MPAIFSHVGRLGWLLGGLLIAVLATSWPVRAQDYGGMVLDHAGVHFLVPSGFELSVSEVRGPDGPVDIILLEPQDGVVAGRPNGGFLSLWVYADPVTVDGAIERAVGDLSVTFSNMTVTAEEMALAGAPRSGVRLDFTLVGVPLVGRLAGFRADEKTVVAYLQGRPEDLEPLLGVFEAILASVGPGPAPSPRPQPVARPDEGTGAGTGMASPSDSRP